MDMRTSNELPNNVASDETLRDLDDHELEQVFGGASSFQLFFGKIWAAIAGDSTGDYDDSAPNAVIGVRG